MLSSSVSGDDILAAVDEDHLSLHHLRLRTGKEFNQSDIVLVRDVSAAGIAGRLLRQEGVGSIAEEVADGLGVESAWGDLKNPLIFKFKKKTMKAGFFGFDLGEALQSMDESPAKPVSISW